jgi:tetratricopeptide (TPR) repeat protein
MEDRTRTLLGTAALVAIVFACYAPSLPGGFLWDDDANVTANPTIRSLRGLRYIWTEPHANQQFYPLTHTSFWLEYQLWELWPTGFRITNLLLHSLVAALLWTTLRRLAVPGAWVAAAIFALHPVHVETAAWITERKNLLSALLYFAALLAWLRFAGLDGRPASARRGRLAYAASLILFIGALLSKTAVLTLPAAILVIAWWKRGRSSRPDVLSTLPMFAIGAVFGLATTWLERQHVGATGAAWDLGLGERIIVAGRAVWFYATQLVFPFRLNFICPRWAVDAAAVWQYAFPAAALALPVLLWRRRERMGRGPLAGVLYYGLTLAPALGLIGFYFQLYAFVQDHLQYLASAGLIALLAALATTGLKRWNPRVAIAAAAVVLVVLGGLTWQRSKHFTGEEALWTSVLERNPRAWMADVNLGLVYKREGRLDEAEERFRHALEHEHPEHDKARYNLGLLLEERGDFEGAGRQYELALAFNPRHPESHNALGSLLAGEGRTEEAIARYRAAIDAEPRFIQARYNLALQLAESGSLFEAEKHLREAIRINPGYTDALETLGRVVARQGRHDETVELYRRVLALDPGRFEVHYNLGLSFENLRDLETAERHYRAAIRLSPDLAEAHNNLAIVLYHSQRYDEAWEEVRRLEELGRPPHPDFLAALAEARPRPGAGE